MDGLIYWYQAKAYVPCTHVQMGSEGVDILERVKEVMVSDTELHQDILLYKVTTAAAHTNCLLQAT